MGNMHGQLQKNVGCALGPEMTHSPHFGNKYFPYIFKTSTFTQFLMPLIRYNFRKMWWTYLRIASLQLHVLAGNYKLTIETLEQDVKYV